MKASLQQTALTARRAGLDRLWNVEALEQRVLLSGIGDGLDLKKAKFIDSDGDKVKIKLSGKNTFDITLTPDGDVDTLTLHNTNPKKPIAELTFKIKPAKKTASDGLLFVDTIIVDPDLTLLPIQAPNVIISNLDTGSGTNNFTFNHDLGDLTINGHIESLVIQGGHDLVGNVTALSIGRIILNGGDILGNVTTTSEFVGIGSIQAKSLAGNVSVASTLGSITLDEDLSGDVSFASGTLTLLIGGDVTETGSITGDSDAGTTDIAAGDFTRLGVIGNFAGTIDADGAVGLGVGGDLLSTAQVSAAGDLTVKARTLAADLESTGGDVAFAMTTGGLAGAITAADDVRGNGTGGAIIIRGGDFTGTIVAGSDDNEFGDVAPISFLPSTGGFRGAIDATGAVGDISANFFASTTSITGSSIGNLTANRANAGDAIATGAVFTATNGSIGSVTAAAIGSIAIGGSFTASETIGNVSASSSGNTSADHALSGATFNAVTIGTVTASARAGSGINDSTFTAVTAIGNISATSLSGHGFRASADGLNLFTVTDGDLGDITGSSTLGDGIHGGTFTASDSIGNIRGTSSSGNGIGDGTGGVSTTLLAIGGGITAISGASTGGAFGSGGDGISNVLAQANVTEEQLGIGAISGSSQFGTGISSSEFSAEGDIRLISGATNNNNPSIDEDGIFDSVFRTASDIGGIAGRTGITGGAGIGAAIEASTFSAGGSISGSAVGSGAPAQGETFVNGDVFVAIGNSQVQWRKADGTLVQTLVSAVQNNNFTTGMAFDSTERLYVTMFDSDAVSIFNPDGTFLSTFGSGYDAHPESILFDTSGNVYVGQADGEGDILKFDAAGNLLAQFDVARTNRGTDWIELAADQATIFYTSEGQEIKRFDVVNNVQLPDFNAGPLPGSHAYALRINPSDGTVFVADSELIARLDASGNVIKTYDAPNEDVWFALNLDPDGTSFWSADLSTGDVFKFDIETGDVLLNFNAGEGTVGGITVKGEITAGGGGGGPAINITGDVLNSQFLAGYDIGPNRTLDGTGGDAEEAVAAIPVTFDRILVAGDWINSFAASGITTTDSTLGDADDALGAPGSTIKNISISSNIAGDVDNPGGLPSNNFQSDAIDNISADAIGIDPNSGSAPAAVGFTTDFSNGELGTIGAISASTSTQRQAIGDGTIFLAGTSIQSITVANENTSFNNLNAIGAATFEAQTFIGDITASTNFSPFGITIIGASFTAHENNPETGLAIGNVTVTERAGTVRDAVGIAGTLFDASSPTVANTPLNIGAVDVYGNVGIDNLFDFAPVTFLATGDIARGARFVELTHVTTADLDGNGNLDWVVTSRISNSVLVVLGNGDGTFGRPTAAAVGDAPIMTVVVDVNGDSVLDLVTLNTVEDPGEPDTVSVLIGAGDGTFASHLPFAIGTQSTPTSIAFGDWIGDGFPDLAITDSAGTVTILKNMGGGSFSEAAVSDLVAGSSPSAVAVTNPTGKRFPPPVSFNADGYIDMAVANFASNTVSIFLGNVGETGAGTGAWSSATDFSVGAGPSSLAIGSLDPILNTRLDLVVANEFSNNVSVLLGDGAGSFGAATNLPVGTNPKAVLLVDVNGDNRLDIVTANEGSDNVSVLLGNGFGGFGAATHFAVGSRPVSIASGDFDKDGFVDLIVVNKDSASLIALFGDGSGSFERRNIFTDPTIVGIKVTGNIAGSAFIADFDENGSGSLAGIGGIQVLPGPGNLIGDPATNTVAAVVQGHIYGVNASPTFQGGSNDPTSGLAIGDITVQSGDITNVLGSVVLYGVDSATFRTVGAIPDLNIGNITTTGGSFGSVAGPATTFTATGEIGNVTSAFDIATGTTFLADSDTDGSGDIADITADIISDGTFIANNVALDNAITVTSGISGLNVTATTGSIGDLLVSQDEGNSSGVGAANITFAAAVDIGDIRIRFTFPPDAPPDPDVILLAGNVLASSTFRAGQSDPTGKIGEIVLENIIEDNDSEAVNGARFSAGAGGIGDITVTTVGQGAGIVGSTFRAAGTVDATHRANIGNITVETISNSGELETLFSAITGSVFSALGNIGVGTGNENDLNIEVVGSVNTSRFLAGYDIGDDLVFDGDILGSDDALATAVAFINKVNIDGLFINSDLIVGVNPGADHVFGTGDDVAAVIGSSIGTMTTVGFEATEMSPAIGIFVPEDPLTPRQHAISADLIGQFFVNTESADLPGFLLGANVNVRVL